MRDTEKLQFASKLVGEVELPEQKRDVQDLQDDIERLRKKAFDKRMEDHFEEEGEAAVCD